jgi:uncharacterized protein YkwD
VPDVAQCLAMQNSARAQYGVPGLQWDESLASGALAWAQVMSASNSLHHSTFLLFF